MCKKASSKAHVKEKAGSGCPRCLNKGLCKYDCGYVSPASSNLRKDLQKR